MAHHRVLHGRARDADGLHGHHAHPARLPQRHEEPRQCGDSVRRVLRADAPARAGARERVRALQGDHRGHGAGREHQRRTGLQPLHVHRQGQRGFERDYDHRHHPRCHRLHAAPLQAPSRHHRSGECPGHRHEYHPGCARPHFPRHDGQELRPQSGGQGDAHRARGGSAEHRHARRVRRGSGEAAHPGSGLCAAGVRSAAAPHRRGGRVRGA
mmetsp:Transcript_71228/g.122400  ORF Transcript_71228/g.122400 Transcript_71228/m.122400 type:complete len:212 (+) Transcript_71228:333-968(+)